MIRQGERRRIPGREVVRGDIIIVAEGDRVPADAMLVSATELLMDESLLTGESIAVRKRPRRSLEEEPGPAGGDDLPAVYSGSLAVHGLGAARVYATGPRTEIGRIGRTLASIDPAAPRLAAQTRRLVRAFAILGLGASVVTVAVFGMLRGSWLEASLAGIALGMSMLPEEFPLVLTVFMVMGARRISQAHVLTRRSAAIETLGSATVLCTDKTGTLTENHMSVVALAADGILLEGKATATDSLVPEIERLLRVGALASAPEAIDPMDRAIRTAAGNRSEDGSLLVHSYGLQPSLLAVTQVWRRPEGTSLVIAAKGAPEAIIGLCGLDAGAAASAAKAVDAMAQRGIRVLAVAVAE